MRWLLLVACLSLFVIAACGGDDDDGSSGSSGSSGGAKKGGSITISQTSQPDYMDPALTYTVNGIEPLWLVYTPLITYAREEGQAGAKLIPGLAEALPEISEDGMTYKLKLRERPQVFGRLARQGVGLRARDQARSQPGVGW